MYYAFLLDEKSKQMIREIIPVKTGMMEVIHHVTLFYNPPKNIIGGLQKKFSKTTVLAKAVVEDENGVALICSVNGKTERMAGFEGTYHVTHSLKEGIKPVYSNRLIAEQNPRYFPCPILLIGHVQLVD